MGRRKRVLIVNCYWPETRVPMQLPNEMPMPLAPVHLAGHFAPRRWEIRLYNEVANGHLELFSGGLLDWPDVVVFCGLTAAFDRFLHLSAYFRTRNPSVVIIAGGLAVRLLPGHAAAQFDYACRGDVEEIREVIAEAFGAEFVADDPVPRYDLAHWMGRWIGYAESSRNCNFRCSFCTLTADALPWRGTDAGLFMRHLEAMGPRVLLHIADNQFAGAGRDAFAERLEVLRRAREKGLFRWWAGFVTDAFLWDEENLRRAKESGCISLLIGVESFDNQWLRRMNKAQNVREPQQALIRRCLEAGILFQYGLVFDPTERRVADMERELDVIAADPSIPAPNFIFVATPFPGTPFFAEKYERGLILPGTKVRDLDGSTLNLRALDGEEAAAHFLRTTKNLVGRRRSFLAHQARFHWRYRGALEAHVHVASALTIGSIMSPQGLSNMRYLLRARSPRTHIGATDLLDPVYTPSHRVDAKFAASFQPTMVTLADGSLNPALADDLLRARRTRVAAAVA
ncbi:MAG: radical SAM protein [Gemmatimonadaceae bacterium]|nr:radical SAM protein [Gemmatimonadaceae bacterium]